MLLREPYRKGLSGTAVSGPELITSLVASALQLTASTVVSGPSSK